MTTAAPVIPPGGADPAPGAGEAAASSGTHDHAADSSHKVDPASHTVDPSCDAEVPDAHADSRSDSASKTGEAHCDGWHEVTPGGVYDTVEDHVVVANDLAKIPEVN